MSVDVTLKTAKLAPSRDSKIAHHRRKQELFGKFKSTIGQIISDEEIDREISLLKIEYFLLTSLELYRHNSAETEMIFHSAQIGCDIESEQLVGKKENAVKEAPLKPFILLPSRQDQTRSRLQTQVFKPSHNLPTMSIDEYLTKEFQRGNVIGSVENSERYGNMIQTSHLTLDRKRRGFIEDFSFDSIQDLMIDEAEKERQGQKGELQIGAEIDREDAYDELLLIEQRERDVFRDDIKRGSGNTNNRS